MKGVVVPKGKRKECEEEVTSNPFLIIRRQLGTVSYWPLMANKVKNIHLVFHLDYLHLVQNLPDLFFAKYSLLFKNV